MNAQETTQVMSRPDDITAGTILPEHTVPITATLVASGAIATRDFQLVHHDRDVAQAAGTKDIFMNILTTNGLVNSYIGRWAGPMARVHRINIRLGAPNFPGDEMLLAGAVESVDGDHVTVSVTGTNNLGTHVSGTVDLTIPSRKETA
ncbi:MaoC/PaaZ C-terminal domain-containing protein [Arthrobacter rhombi]|uniref:MaoC/PaaZ C-terminal domain-containing protein n=1 Tax=Arthrobacter rhombi TaxID=71253 RepID=UPI003FD11559